MGALADALINKGGYNPTDALNAESGPRAAELTREFLGGGSSGSSGVSSGGSSGSGGSLEDYFASQQQLQTQANAPAIQSLQAGIPQSQATTQAQVGQLQAEIAPLTDRYKQLLSDIKGQDQTQVEQQTRVTAGELGKRGIEGSSTLAGQEIVSANRPIQQQTQSLTQQTGLAQEADLRDINNQIQNLGIGQQEREQSINQAIAQLQAGGGQSSIQNAMQLLGNAQQMQVAQEQASSTQRQRDIENALAKIQSESGVKLTNAQIQNIQSQIADRGSTNAPAKDIQQYYSAPGVTNVTNTNGLQSKAGGTFLPQASSWSTQ